MLLDEIAEMRLNLEDLFIILELGKAHDVCEKDPGNLCGTWHLFGSHCMVG